MSIIESILHLQVPVLHHWGYLLIFFAALLETIPLLGILIPGQAVVVLGGFLAKTGILDIGDIIFISALGAILGDSIGYFLGKKYGYSFLLKYGKYFFFKKEYLKKTKKMMHQHIGKTLIFGRFHSLTRAFAPFVAGTMEIPQRKFLVYNLFGGIAWAVFFVFVGYLFGKSYEVISPYLGKFIFAALALSILLFYLYRFINKRKHLFEKDYMYVLLLNIFSLLLFSKLVEDILKKEFITHIDAWVTAHIILLRNTFLNKVMIFISTLGNTRYLFFFFLVFIAILIWKKKWYSVFLAFLSMGGGFFLQDFFKQLIHRPRPEFALVSASGYSFPSGHATMALLFFSLLFLSLQRELRHRLWNYIFLAGCIISILLMGFSRIYLGVHWLSDVLAGFSLGIFLLTFLMLVFRTFSLTEK